MCAFKCVCIYCAPAEGGLGTFRGESSKYRHSHQTRICQSRTLMGERTCVPPLMPLSIGCNYGPPTCPLVHTDSVRQVLLGCDQRSSQWNPSDGVVLGEYASKLWILYLILEVKALYHVNDERNLHLRCFFIDWLVCSSDF